MRLGMDNGRYHVELGFVLNVAAITEMLILRQDVLMRQAISQTLQYCHRVSCMKVTNSK